MIFSLILGILLGAVAVVFVLQNISVVTVAFLDWQIQGSLALVLLLAIICGIVMTLLVLLPSLIRGDFYLSTLKKRQKELEDELASTKRALQAASPSMRGEPTLVEKAA